MTGNGDPDFPGGIGCPLCDSLWDDAESIDKHLDEVHHTTYDDATRYVPEFPAWDASMEFPPDPDDAWKVM